MVRLGFLWCLPVVALLLNACIGSNSEGAKLYRALYKHAGPQSWVEELENYPLEQQYEVFLHGMHRVHPPDSRAARAIAKRGKPAVDYVLRMVAASGEDWDYAFSMEIFEAMVRGRHYLVCADVEAMSQIEANGTKIADEGWRKLYELNLQWLEELCVSNW
ncbi:MAG: hypothetical protein F4169_19975 [Gammaproteobacteria bacterium]|nr:hypothetical protein [Gammaproteobacteria bacterium]MYF31085.1 hypothetical protein [Gammaproteobacteria bacterium]MYK28564.1 hypothetical protein [Gammaproteobacteria bacterium]